MTRTFWRALGISGLLLASGPWRVAGAEDESAALAQQAGSILRRYCARCHKGEGSESGYAFDVKNVRSMLEEGMLVAGDHEGSAVYEAMFRAKMPPRNRPQLPRPSAAEVEIVKRWIASGPAEIPEPHQRNPLSLKSDLEAIHEDLSQASREVRPRLRYFSLTHLYNDRTVDETQLGLTRLALAKALNSLSWEPDLVVPRVLNAQQTLFAVDMTALGWDRAHWNALLAAYPYALSYGALDDSRLQELDEKIDELRNDRVPAVLRADWLIAVATKPPLYHTVLYDLALPELRERAVSAGTPANPKSMTDADLEKHLRVDVRDNISRGKAQRSGFTESGVSGQNRLIERHPLTGTRGFYWKSYDFKSSNRTAILTEFPLGPRFDGNPFDSLAFDHDGGEIIFTLPNGLQGYLLVDGKGNRIDAGPIEVVGDSLKTSGNEQIVTGLSCIACHRRGMIESPDDEVRQFSSPANDARDQVRRLYPENDAFRRLLDQDRERFLGAMGELSDRFPVDTGTA
ncbi:MAG: hypothetical protein AB7Q45_26965, partial [Planctomycetaceae bacterium]